MLIRKQCRCRLVLDWVLVSDLRKPSTIAYLWFWELGQIRKLLVFAYMNCTEQAPIIRKRLPMITNIYPIYQYQWYNPKMGGGSQIHGRLASRPAEFLKNELVDRLASQPCIWLPLSIFGEYYLYWYTILFDMFFLSWLVFSRKTSNDDFFKKSTLHSIQ